MKIKYERCEGSSKDFRLTNGTGQDLGDVTKDGRIVYPEDTARKLVRGVHALNSMKTHIAELQTELRQYRARPTDLKPLDLRPLSEDPKQIVTQVIFEDFELQKALTEVSDEYPNGIIRSWLELGRVSISSSSRYQVDFEFKARMRDNITDFEHDSCYIMHIKLTGVQWVGTHGSVSEFNAHITSNPRDIRICDPDFRPEEVEGAKRCDYCEAHHWMLPGDYFIPKPSEVCRLVAGKRISILTGPRDQEHDD